MSAKKLIFSVAAIIVIAAVVYLIIYIQRSDKDLLPRLTIAHVNITNLAAEKVDMQLGLLIDNPSPVSLRADSLFYRVYIAGNEIMKTTYPDPVELEAGDSATVSLPLTIYHDRLLELLNRLEQEGRDSAEYKIVVTVFSDSKLIPDQGLDVDLKKDLPVIKLPEVKLTDLKIDKAGIPESTIAVALRVYNGNRFPLGFRKMNYRLQIDDNEALEGSKQEDVHIPAGDTVSVAVPVSIDLGGMGESFIDLIREGQDLSYRFTMNSEVISNLKPLNNSKLQLEMTGNLQDIREQME